MRKIRAVRKDLGILGKKRNKKKEFLPELTPAEQKEKEQLYSKGELPKEINRSLDLYFRFLLGHPERTDLLIDVLNSVFVPLGHPKIKNVSLRETEIAPSQVLLRHVRLDVLADDEMGRPLNLEIQTWKDTLFPDRLALYNGRLFDLQTRHGEKLDILRQTCSIALLAYNMFEDDEDKNSAVWDFMFRDSTGKKTLTDKQWIILVEMPKLCTQVAKLQAAIKENPAYELTSEDRKVLWSAYFMNMAEGVKLMETLTQDRVFSQVPVLEKEYWADIDNRYRQYRIEMEENAREAEKRKIRRDSLAEGRYEKTVETVQRMIAEHLPEDMIARISGLSKSELGRIRTEL